VRCNLPGGDVQAGMRRLRTFFVFFDLVSVSTEPSALRISPHTPNPGGALDRQIWRSLVALEV